jgi:hypothetical protein
MNHRDVHGIRIFEATLLQSERGVVHGYFSRRGGISPEPWGSLNLGGSVGDDPLRVAENRRRAISALGRNPASVYDVFQVHGREVIQAHAPRPPDQPHLRADAIITDRPEVTLLMRFADCVPVLLYDPICRAVGIAHAGWQGTVLETPAAALQAMGAAFGTRPEDVLASIGPSIGAHHYPVGEEVARRVREVFGQDADTLLNHQNGGSPCFDLWAANALSLTRWGVRRVDLGGLCTACDLDHWYSHRAEAGKTGRFGAAIGLTYV